MSLRKEEKLFTRIVVNYSMTGVDKTSLDTLSKINSVSSDATILNHNLIINLESNYSLKNFHRKGLEFMMTHNSFSM